ncbi:MAG: bifunctional precorrin-2 dehydrogenase/sirohydrochlorin ferrochelatase [Acidobacteriota bacterium]|nr:bifunctional precorrin-2 dehydrogenase/sirohydrochlorin ferrochelatase [Acidobacteriota bacterium]
MTGQTPLLPVFMKVQGRSCLVVGGGSIALEKIRVLLDCGASIRVVAPEAIEELQQLARNAGILLDQKKYSEGDLHGASVVIAATDDRDLNHRVYTDAVARGQLVNVVDDPEYCDFYFGCIVRRGALQVAISTSGESPAFAQRLKEEINEALPADTGSWLDRLGELRRHINQAVEAGPARISLLRELARRETCDPATCPCRSLTPAAH